MEELESNLNELNNQQQNCNFRETEIWAKVEEIKVLYEKLSTMRIDCRNLNEKNQKVNFYLIFNKIKIFRI